MIKNTGFYFQNTNLPGNGDWVLKAGDISLDQRSSAIPLVILNQDQFPFEDPEVKRKYNHVHNQ
jgi:hypothetical protein